ncbi:MAG TPA: hypothetical protein VE863_22215 [Pyrinomonadaceae bacterium]|nr:hypothetical protein [Pyrinomonadaceae bacterium]
MSQPEISHRCPSCGVSIRDFGEGILFCPECGKPLASSGAETDTGNSAKVADDVQVSTSAAAASDSHTLKSASPGVSDDQAPVQAGVRTRARDRTRETLHRASDVARGAIERPVKQVEKIHHVSTVMLEEATYDPSLRFVLVALGLFVLFIILLVLSKVMG